MFPLPLHIYFEIAAAIAAVIFLMSPTRSKLGWFIPFLWMIVVVELAARYMRYELTQANAWLYGLSVPCEYIFYAFIFRETYQNRKYKTLASWFMVGFLVYAIISIAFITNLNFFDMNQLLIGSTFMIIFSVLYFMDVYHHTGEESIFKLPMFWIATGIFLFNTGEFCYNLLSTLVFSSAYDPRLEIFSQINNRLILVLYSCLIIGFICQKTLGTYKKDSVAM